MSFIRDRLPALRNRAFVASDLALLPLCAVVAFAARYDGLDHPEVRSMLRVFVLSVVPIKVLLLLWLGLYRRLWRYASVADVERLVLGAGACAAVDIVLGTVGLRSLGVLGGRISYAVILLDACLSAVAIALPRLAIRVAMRPARRQRDAGFRRTIVVGAGAAGGLIVRELAENSQLGMVPVALLDDDPRKHGLRLHNVPVLGNLGALERVASADDAERVFRFVRPEPAADRAPFRDMIVAHGSALTREPSPVSTKSSQERSTSTRCARSRSRISCAASRSRRISSRLRRW